MIQKYVNRSPLALRHVRQVAALVSLAIALNALGGEVNQEAGTSGVFIAVSSAVKGLSDFSLEYSKYAVQTAGDSESMVEKSAQRKPLRPKRFSNLDTFSEKNYNGTASQKGNEEGKASNLSSSNPYQGDGAPGLESDFDFSPVSSSNPNTANLEAFPEGREASVSSEVGLMTPSSTSDQPSPASTDDLAALLSQKSALEGGKAFNQVKGKGKIGEVDSDDSKPKSTFDPDAPAQSLLKNLQDLSKNAGLNALANLANANKEKEEEGVKNDIAELEKAATPYGEQSLRTAERLLKSTMSKKFIKSGTLQAMDDVFKQYDKAELREELRQYKQSLPKALESTSTPHPELLRSHSESQAGSYSDQ